MTCGSDTQAARRATTIPAHHYVLRAYSTHIAGGRGTIPAQPFVGGHKKSSPTETLVAVVRELWGLEAEPVAGHCGCTSERANCHSYASVRAVCSFWHVCRRVARPSGSARSRRSASRRAPPPQKSIGNSPLRGEPHVGSRHQRGARTAQGRDMDKRQGQAGAIKR